MSLRIKELKVKLEPLRQEIINHKVYDAIHTLKDLQVFMNYHVFAVWDFMSLLKALQRNLTCTTIPWFPKGTGNSRFLINEIVCGEESDIDQEGKRKSHFELYLDAMQQCGADISQIHLFCQLLNDYVSFSEAYEKADVPVAVREFVDFTFGVVQCDKPHIQSAVFTFGREDLIPEMFYTLVNDIHAVVPDKVSIFKYYLERHIEIDGDHHSHLALEMTSNLCGVDDKFWLEAEQASIQSLERRIKLWDGVYQEINAQRK